MSGLRVTVCQLPDDRTAFEAAWLGLTRHIDSEGSQLVVLPEMPFAPWFAVSPEFRDAIWRGAVLAHESWLPRLADLSPAAVLSSRPVTRAGRRLNEGFAWADGDYRAVHHKRFLPDEDGYWEARWYQPGDDVFEVAPVAGARVGMLICTELWSLGHAQAYGKAGTQVLATPRATGRSTADKWLAGGRVAAVVAGAFGVSSNWCADEHGGDFGGLGWIVGPDGDVLARTSPERPAVTIAIDLAQADAAKRTYPRYALD